MSFFDASWTDPDGATLSLEEQGAADTLLVTVRDEGSWCGFDVTTPAEARKIAAVFEEWAAQQDHDAAVERLREAAAERARDLQDVYREGG